MPQPSARLPFLLTHCREPEPDPGGRRAPNWALHGVWGCRAGGVGAVLCRAAALLPAPHRQSLHCLQGLLSPTWPRGWRPPGSRGSWARLLCGTEKLLHH